MSFDQSLDWGTMIFSYFKPVLENIPIFVGSGGLLSTVIFVYNHYAKKREETVNMSKYRMDRLERKNNEYMKIIRTSYNISKSLPKYCPTIPTTRSATPIIKSTMPDYDGIELFVSMLNFTRDSNDVIKHGNFLLTDQEAEGVLSDLTRSSLKIIKNDIFKTDYSEFLSLNSTKPLHKITSDILKSTTVYHKCFDEFNMWASRNNSQREALAKILGCISDLLLLEINIAHKSWYGNKKFKSKEFLSEESKNYLFNIHVFDNDMGNGVVTEENFKSRYKKYHKKIKY